MMVDNEAPNFAQVFWSAAPELQRALDYDSGEYTLEDIFEYVLAGDMQLWVAPGWTLLTEIIQYPRKKRVLVRLLTGDMQSILDNHDVIVRFAEMVGADEVELVGRKGWSKVLKQNGWREVAVHMVREI